jgi:hypothetical protein
MIAMTFTIELDIGLSYLLQSALPQLVTDRETKHIVVDGPSDRPAMPARTEIPEAEPLQALRLHAGAFRGGSGSGCPIRPAR